MRGIPKNYIYSTVLLVSLRIPLIRSRNTGAKYCHKFNIQFGVASLQAYFFQSVSEAGREEGARAAAAASEKGPSEAAAAASGALAGPRPFHRHQAVPGGEDRALPGAVQHGLLASFPGERALFRSDQIGSRVTRSAPIL